MNYYENKLIINYNKYINNYFVYIDNICLYTYSCKKNNCLIKSYYKHIYNINN